MQPDEQFDAQLEFAEAAVLAGGASRRMGQDKTLLPIGNQSLIEIVVQQLTSLFHRVRIIANEEEKFADLNLTVQPDIRPGCGPLGGIHSALATAQQDTVFVAGCDFPFLNTSFIKGLAELLGDSDVVLPRYLDRPVAVCAFYSIRCLPAIEASLDRGAFRAVSFFKDVKVRWVQGDELAKLDPNGLALTNLNTPEDYLQAKESIERQGKSG
jgi:molybdopterin-guanine dinucleotide biosynthesis protein A